MRIPGWINVDAEALPGVDRVVDVRRGLPFDDVELIFAEHFLEHLTLAEGLAFLRECRRVLRYDGTLRLSTPNLDWVWLTHYRPPSEMTSDQSLDACLALNRAFHGWGHRFLYNRQMLTAALHAAGFARCEEHGYGESRFPELRGLERHPLDPAASGVPSVVIIEARGRRPPSDDLAVRAREYLCDLEAGR